MSAAIHSLYPRDSRELALRQRIAVLGFPVFVKPSRAGSSQGISKVHSMAELDDAIDGATHVDPNAESERLPTASKRGKG